MPWLILGATLVILLQQLGLTVSAGALVAAAAHRLRDGSR